MKPAYSESSILVHMPCIASFIILFMSVPLGAQTTAPAESLKDHATIEDRVNTLVRDLGSPIWRKRQQATELLIQVGPDCLDSLKRACRTAPDYETRSRIKQAAEAIFLVRELGPPRAFLGIRYPSNYRPSANGFEESPAVSAIVITAIFEGSAADVAGLKTGDHIHSFDGRWVKSDKLDTDDRLTVDEFAVSIGKHVPGESCRFGVLRGAEHQFFRDRRWSLDCNPAMIDELITRPVGGGDDEEDDANVPADPQTLILTESNPIALELKLRVGDVIHDRKRVTRVFQASSLAGLEVKPLTQQEEPRVVGGGAGLLITRVDKSGLELGLKEGDLILALDGRRLPAEGTEEFYRKWLEAPDAEAFHAAIEKPTESVPAGTEATKKESSDERPPGRSAQILRGGRWLDLTAILGRRPDFIPQPDSADSAELARKDQALHDFERWWEEAFKRDNAEEAPVSDDRWWETDPDRADE